VPGCAPPAPDDTRAPHGRQRFGEAVDCAAAPPPRAAHEGHEGRFRGTRRTASRPVRARDDRPPRDVGPRVRDPQHHGTEAGFARDGRVTKARARSGPAGPIVAPAGRSDLRRSAPANRNRARARPRTPLRAPAKGCPRETPRAKASRGSLARGRKRPAPCRTSAVARRSGARELRVQHGSRAPARRLPPGRTRIALRDAPTPPDRGLPRWPPARAAERRARAPRPPPKGCHQVDRAAPKPARREPAAPQRGLRNTTTGSRAT
jgi:hypothetical protein